MNHFSSSLTASALPQLLQALRMLYPPQCVVHVGIGQGMGELSSWRHWPELPRALLIDADDARLAWARQGQNPHWQVLQATVADTAGQHTFHRATNPQEDGLLPPDQQKAWWPQLATLSTDTHQAQTLDQLVPTSTAISPDQQPLGHWLLLECLPAAQLLRGATHLLAHTNVVCARTSQVSAAASTANTPLVNSSHQALIELLAPQGFVLLAQTETLHPALGYTLMARQPDAPMAQPIAQAPRAAEPPVISPPQASPSEQQAENDALRHRLSLLQEELLRAEGQINLIKDLMLRDQEL